MRIFFLSIFLFIACAVGQAQIYTPIGGNGQRIAGFKVTRALTIPTDTLKPVDKSIDSLGTLAVGPDSLLYLYNGKKYNRVTGAAFNGILNQSTLQTGAVFNVDRGIITQASGGSTTTALPAALASPFTIAGGNGISTTANTGTVTAGRAGDISVRPGQGGNQNTAGASFGGGGRGGNIDITAGNGGLGNGSGMISGNGGTMTVQGGDAGPIGTGAISGEPGWLKLAGGSANPGSNGNGKSVFIIPGAGYGTGFHGDTYIGTSPALVYRGRALVGFTLDPSLITTKQIFQVNGTSWFKDTLTLSNIASKILKTDASGNVIPAVPGTDYLASVSSGNLTETGSSILTITGGTGAVLGSGTTLQVKQASTTQNGFLSSTDWNTFNGKLSTVDTTNISNFSFKVRSLHSAGTGLSYNAATGAFANTGVLTVNGAVGAITIDTTSITNFSTKVRSLFSAGGDLQYVPASGVITVQRATTGSNGTLSSTDWNTFNNKLSTVDTTNISNFNVKVRSLFSGTAPITYGNGLIGIIQATTSTNGYLSSTDWNTFNGKQAAFGTQTANTVYAGPTTGTAATPSFRALVAADIPTLAAYIQNQNGAAQTTSNFWISGNGRIDGTFVTTGAAPTFTALATGGMLKSNTSGQLQIAVSGTDYAPATGSSAYAPITGGSNYIQNQNSSAQTANMFISGSVQANGSASIFGQSTNSQSVVQVKASAGSFNLTTDNAGNNGTTANEFFIFGQGKYLNVQDVTGNVGINVSAPTVKLDVGGDIRSSTTIITPTLSVAGGMRVGIRTTAASTTLLSSDHTLICTASGITLTLGAASGFYLSNTGGQVFVIENFNTGGAVTLSTGYLSKTSATPVTSITTGTVIWIQSDGTNWRQIN